MAFNYAKLLDIKKNIDNETEGLQKTLSNFSALISENVNNPQVWQGDSATGFKNRWDNFADTNFPMYKEGFNRQSSAIFNSVRSYESAEGK